MKNEMASVRFCVGIRDRGNGSFFLLFRFPIAIIKLLYNYILDSIQRVIFTISIKGILSFPILCGLSKLCCTRRSDVFFSHGSGTSAHVRLCLCGDISK